MQQEFLNISPDTWCIIFDIIRYVVVALILAYLTNVFVKRENIRTDIKGWCWNGEWKPTRAYING